MRHIKTIMILILILISVMLINAIFQEPYTTSEKIKKEFYNNYETVSEIAEYLMKSPYSKISVSNVDYIYDDGLFGHWYVYNKDSASSSGEYVVIENSDIVNKLSNIFKQRKYQFVKKDGNMVRFQLWANLDEGRGFVYSVKEEPTMQNITKLERIETSWYYYETNSNNAPGVQLGATGDVPVFTHLCLQTLR